jgi:hypothetical protein
VVVVVVVVVRVVVVVVVVIVVRVVILVRVVNNKSSETTRSTSIINQTNDTTVLRYTFISRDFNMERRGPTTHSIDFRVSTKHFVFDITEIMSTSEDFPGINNELSPKQCPGCNSHSTVSSFCLISSFPLRTTRKRFEFVPIIYFVWKL